MRIPRVAIIPLLLTLVLAAVPPLAAQNGQVPTLAPMLEQVGPAVVNVSTTSAAAAQQNPLLQDPFFRRFFEGPDAPPQPPEGPMAQSLGSGVIVDAENGYIITNAHVVEAAEEITVSLTGGRELPAQLVGSDPETDVAVLQVDAAGLKLIEIPFGDSDQLRVGDPVVALGNPFGLGQTATSGIVSALERSGLNIEGYESFIQTDASINPGNSGGALLTPEGELIGINTAILSPAGGNIGIGFAIPVNMVRIVADQLIEHGEVQRGQLGVLVQDLTPALAEAFGLEVERGALVAQVQPDSAAARAGLESGDVIVGVDGEEVDSASVVRNRIGLMPVGQSAELTVVRGDERRQVEVEIAEREARPGRPGAQDEPVAGISGLEGAALEAIEVEIDGEPAQRVGVAAVAPGSPAAQAGLLPGDVILSVNREPAESVEQLEQQLAEGEQAVLLLQRGEGAFFLPLG